VDDFTLAYHVPAYSSSSNPTPPIGALPIPGNYTVIFLQGELLLAEIVD
jgi:hypothetical protein